MRRTERARIAVGIAIAASVAMLGLAGCGRLGDDTSAGPTDDTSGLPWDAQALQSIGYSTEELGPATSDPAADDSADSVGTGANAAAAPTQTAKPGKAQERRAKFKRLRFRFGGKRMLHGEAVVQTDEGLKTVVVQRGQVTEVTGTTFTVKSTDGYTVSWTIGTKFTVAEDRKKVDKSAITVGATVGVAGEKSGDTSTARLMVITPG